LAASVGLGRQAAEECALSTSELATNLVRYAIRGELLLSPVRGPSGTGLEIESVDHGPGIADVERALRDGFSTGGGLGGGLPGVRRMMDEIEIATGPAGTRIVARKWPKRP
jgi:serine/threonine-protein kinase RsbT